MHHLPQLIQDLAVILGTAALASVIFQKLRLPVMLGYLVAGFLVGPYVPFLPSVADPETMRGWAEVGVIVLLFTIGLEFSLRKLAHAGKTAVPAGVFQFFVMLGLGFLTGKALGWDNLNSLFLGGIVSIASTTVIFRVLGDMDLMNRSFVPLVVGVLLVEDVLAVLLIVLLTTVAVTRTLEGSALLWTTGQIVFFLVLWVVLGTFLVPRFVGRIARELSEEMTLVVGLGLCFLMVIVAVHSGFSPALGAFVMGSLLSETAIGPKLHDIIKPVRDLFGAVFFVSVGTLADPSVATEAPGTILAVAAVTLLGRSLVASLGAILAGEPIGRSLRAGFCLAQIGEFSFIIATLGVSLNVTDPWLPSVTIAVAALTMMLAPIFMARSTRWSMIIQNWIPEHWHVALEGYRLRVHHGPSGFLGPEFRDLAVKVLVNAVLIVAITLGTGLLLIPMAEAMFGSSGAAVCGFGALLAAAPFFWGLVAGAAPVESEWRPGAILTALRVVLALSLLIFMVNRFFPGPAANLSLLAIALTAPFWGRRFARRIYLNLEKQLAAQFLGEARMHADGQPALAPWDATLAEFTVPAGSDLVGRTLLDSALKERYGVAITMIERGSQRILAPGRDTIIFPGDHLFMIGTDAQLDDASSLFRAREERHDTQSVDYGLSSVVLPEGSPYVGRTIRHSGLRERIDGLIVGLERGGERHLNPDSGLTLQAGDLLWIVGDIDKIHSFEARPAAP